MIQVTEKAQERIGEYMKQNTLNSPIRGIPGNRRLIRAVTGFGSG